MLFSDNAIAPPCLAKLALNLQLIQPSIIEILLTNIAPPLPPLAVYTTLLLLKVQFTQFSILLLVI